MIRKAKQTDAKQISRLIKKNYLGQKKDKKQGFLRYKRSPQKVKKIINNSLAALVYVKNNKIIGFMNAYPQKKPTKKKIKWKNEKLKNLYFDKKKSATAYLGVIDPEYLHQGIGSKLFNQLVGQLRHHGYKNLFASVTTKPITNKASLNFLKNKNFKKAARAKIKNKTNTETAIYMKKI